MNPQRIEKQTPGAEHPGKIKTRSPVSPLQQAAQQSVFDAPTDAPDASGEAVPRTVMRGTDTLKQHPSPGAKSPLPPGAEPRKTGELRPHPAMVQCNLLPTAVQLEPLHKAGMRIFELPLLICHDGTIIDGYKRWVIAKDLGHPTLMCMVLVKSEEDALRLILENACSRNYLNPFCRYALALTLVEPLAAQASENRVLGGRKKQLAKLPKDQKIDVRKEVARLAGCGERNVDEVRLVLERGIDRLKTMAREGTISIDAAAKLAEKGEEQQRFELAVRQSRRDQKRRIRVLSTTGLDTAMLMIKRLMPLLEKAVKVEELAKLQPLVEPLIEALRGEIHVAVRGETLQSTPVA
ncbi:MAG: hypothetical protein ABR860_11505 [Terracidiphilus sp.]|jgi:hypothetical protein